MSDQEIIQFDNVTKVFPGVKALDKVSFKINKGEVHALLGENGAGKSTLLNILHGVYQGYEGNVLIEKDVINFENPHEAIQFGISKVHQEVSLIPELTVGQNITLNYEPKKRLLIDYDKMHEEANKILDKLHCNFRSEDLVKHLSIGEMQMISIAKALFHNAKVISLDEPTASLTTSETETLFQIIRELKENDITIIYVSHRLEEIFKIADKATVLRDGKYIKTFDVKDTTKDELIRSMVGRDVSSFAKRNKPRRFSDEVVLEVNNLTLKPYFKNISFKLRKGEILGFAGLVGAKRTDVVRTIFGANHKDEGEIIVHGNKVDIKSPLDGLENGIGLIPENRKTQGFVKNLNNANNIGLACLDNFKNHIFLDHEEKIENSKIFIDKINLKPKDPLYLTRELSGGNQQKVVLAKWLSTNVDIFIFDEPTKGVDVGAKQEIYKLLEDLVAQGKSIIMVSSELPEVIGMSDRIVVMKEGKLTKILDHKKFSEEKIMHYAMEGTDFEDKKV